MYEDRIRNAAVRSRIMSADEAQAMIKDKMALGLSGFTRAGDAKAVPQALAKRVKATGEKLRVNVYTGASLAESDRVMAEANIVEKRIPYQADDIMRKRINTGDMYYSDVHLSHVAEYVRLGVLPVDIAIIEAVSITENGDIVPTTSVGNSHVFVEKAQKVIVEINTSVPLEFEGVHDIFIPSLRPDREPIMLRKSSDLIGTPYIPCDPDKIAAVVITTELDSPANLTPADDETQTMANYILDFFEHEVKMGRLPKNLGPLQSGVGAVANAVLAGFKTAPFENLEVFTEVSQDAVFELLEAGKLNFASSTSFTLTNDLMLKVINNIDDYKGKVILRPQEIANHPEVARRLGVIAINTALEADIYGNVNSTHVRGTHMMNGIGGSGDFARNAAISFFVTKSLAKGGAISSIVPFVSHVDHTEHDVQVIVTEQGLADLRGLAPRQRAKLIIEKCVHPIYKDQMWDYFKRAEQKGGQTPHLLGEAFSWHEAFEKTGDMRLNK